MKRCSLVYKMAKWNQLFDIEQNFTHTVLGVSVTTDNKDTIHFSGTPSSTGGRTSFQALFSNKKVPLISGHKYLTAGNGEFPSNALFYMNKVDYSVLANLTYNDIYVSTYTGDVSLGWNFTSTSIIYDNYFTICFYDLTDIFGSGNEPTTYETARTAILAEVGIDISEYHNYDPGSTIARRARLASESGATMKRSALVLPKLPREYQEVEYIGSTGTQYVDSGIQVTGEIGYYLENKFDGFDFNAAQTRHGARDAQNLNANTMVSINSNNFRFDYANLQYTPVNLNKRIKSVRFVPNESKNYITYMNNSTEILSIPKSTFTSLYNFGILAYISSSPVISYNAKVTCAKLYNGNTLVRDFVPCFRKSDNTIGLYDLCGSICPLTNSPFYINSGTGTFTKGPNVY